MCSLDESFPHQHRSQHHLLLCGAVRGEQSWLTGNGEEAAPQLQKRKRKVERREQKTTEAQQEEQIDTVGLVFWRKWAKSFSRISQKGSE